MLLPVTPYPFPDAPRRLLSLSSPRQHPPDLHTHTQTITNKVCTPTLGDSSTNERSRKAACKAEIYQVDEKRVQVRRQIVPPSTPDDDYKS